MLCINVLALFFCLLETASTTAVTPPDNKGLEFVLMFMENQQLGSQFPLELYCTTQETKQVQVHVTSPKWSSPKINATFTVTDGQVRKTLIDTVFRMTGSTVSSKALLIQADAEVACYGANKETLSNDVYLGLPVDALGMDYYAMAYSPALIKAELGIASTEDSTHVKITLPRGNGQLDVTFKGTTYHAGDTINIALQQYETLQLQSSGDLTGAHIESDKPVAAFSGNVKTNVGNGKFADHLVEQLTPSDRWGEQFVTAPIPGRTVGDVFKVVAREDNTLITIPGKQPIRLNKGEVAKFELPSDRYHYIESTRPILMAQFVKSQQQATEPADPSMMIIPPYEQFGSDYTFTTPEYSHPEYGNDPSFRYKNEFMIVTKKSDIHGLLLDGKPFPQTSWTDIPGTSLVGSYITLPHGPHTVRHSNPLSTFGGYLYGHAYHESYGFPTGMRTAVIYSNCTPTVSVPGDGIDNDCDNKIDEELCPDSNDDDNDGKVDEDCVKTFPIDGLWGMWSAWSNQCSVTCGDGTLTRTRTCDSPAPKFGGKNCTGTDKDTKSCYGGQPCDIDIAAICAANSSSRVPNPLNCAQYYDCRKRSTLGKSHLLECPYPQLFSSVSVECEDFQKVDCAQRYEPMAPCEYKQNKCNGSDPSCRPCTDRLFSCVTINDGRQPAYVFSPEYKDCKTNRTMGQGKCEFGYYNPLAHRCLPHNPGTLSFYCRKHTSDKLAIPTNCAKFYDCAKPGNTLAQKTNECMYPNLFSSDTGQCENFSTVRCKTRMEPQAPCEYDQNKCPPSNTTCHCPDEHADCRGQTDGIAAWSNKMWGPQFSRCHLNRTVSQGKCPAGQYFHPVQKQCIDTVKPTEVKDVCHANPSMFFQDSQHCAIYINCSATHFSMECKYPDLFSLKTNSCEKFETVQCGTRPEPQAPCDYKQNLCKQADPNCVPCKDRLPTCVGTSDGDQVFPTRMWKPDYITCSKNRTILPTKKCTKGYFHPVQKRCLEDVARPDAKSYCKSNPNDVIPLPDNCAQYIDCSVVTSGVNPTADPVNECSYPDLFSTLSMTCQHFTTVSCDIRLEPQAPCEYDQNQCTKGNTSCSCPDNLPSCVGKRDGDHGFPTRLWKPDYIRCYKNRTILPTKKCIKGYFHPSQQKCTEDVDRRDAHLYCVANPSDVIPTADNCAQFINCTVVILGTTPDPMQECHYPDLFSKQTRTCGNFATVPCDKRREPMAPCEYDQNLCTNLLLVGCTACTTRLPTCVGTADGDQPFPTKLWTENFIHCFKNRTLVDKCPSGAVFDPKTRMCTTKINNGNIDSYCRTYPTEIKANPLNCAQYYNCSDNAAPLGHHLIECKYPDLFSISTKHCQQFESLQCMNRSEPQAPCDYMQNLCQQSDPACVRCPYRLPSCIGKSNGDHAFPSRMWKPDYITCYKNRTINVKRCTHGYFHPTNENCTKEVSKPDAKLYCQFNQNNVVLVSDNCAQYINCTMYISGNVAEPVQECKYPDLFSTGTMKCEKFETVTCDKRNEPMAPCQYETNLCLSNDPTCVPCHDRLPSCISVADGVIAFPKRLWNPNYITCYKNRTVLPLDKCQNGYFHPVQKRCVSDVNKVDAKPYCQSNPHAVVPISGNCAHFIDCVVVLASPTSDPVAECRYPDLFSTVTMVCASFTTVMCNIRPEPQAPCEYDQNICKAGNISCEHCPNRLPSCIGLVDGAQPFATRLWTSNYVQCYKNRTVAITNCSLGNIFDPNTQACVSDIPKGRMDSYCKANQNAIKVDPDNCAQYYNCSSSTTPLGHFKQECKYPDLFSSSSMACQPFENVNCHIRKEPKAPCDYEQNVCKPNDANCEPCPYRIPTCVGKGDGDHAFTNRLWKQDYITCYKERTINTKQCKQGYFHPTLVICTEYVLRTDAKSYCSSNPHAIIPTTDNCAQLINCTAYSLGAVSDPVKDCPYPQLFSLTTMMCQDFTTVNCGKRIEPKAPCEYIQNACASNDPMCVACPDRLPSCKGLSNGDHAFPMRLWKPQFITCYQNRTVLPTKKCANGYFHPIKQMCTETIDKTDANPYCQANPGDMLPVDSDCAKYYKCSASLLGQDVIQECHYPDLFSTLSMTCQHFTTVHCGKRLEPQAPCEYDQNICSKGDPICDPCPDRLPSCVGLGDGDQPAAGHPWTNLYVRCYRNRTTAVKHCPNGAVFNPNRLACISKIKSGDIDSYCQANPLSIKQHDTNCAQYYNCSNPRSSLGSYLQECQYPDIFSTVSLLCESFESVPCGTRNEPQQPCEYLRNLCNGSDPSCVPCQDRLPSCTGLPDGMNAIPGREWKSGYVKCYKNRTISVENCKSGYFHPVTKKCTEHVQRVDVKEYCQKNPLAIVAAADDCAQYYNCSQQSSAIGDYIGECKYPSLFSTRTMTCGSFRRIFCNTRPEPQAPCQYEQNRCSQNDAMCVACPERLPSCIGLPDGAQPHPIHLWSNRYIECFTNHTMSVRTCPKGYFHPRQHQCRSVVDPVDVPEYCTVHAAEILTNPDNCAVYYNCSSHRNGYTMECHYPDLYDTNTKMCSDFSQVQCRTRPEPKDPCQYKQNLCQSNDASCIPCKDRMPSCVRLMDGNHAVPSQQWGPQYVTCHMNRTIAVSRCKTGYFHPTLRSCSSIIDKTDFPSYCHKHPNVLLPHPDNCAQYVNCSEITAQTVFIKECTYPDLFSADTMTCTRFTRVNCAKRMEPQAPCEYSQNMCASGDTSCTPCQQRLPSCIGSPDGARPFTGQEWTENYIECYKNRTVALDRCPIGAIFDSIDLSCTSKIDKNAIQSFCQFNSVAIQEHPDNCAQYFNCSAPGSLLGPYLMECSYPKLFSPQIKQCVDFESARCGSKKEPERPCDYLHNLCAPQDLTCTSCQSRLPSCVGLSDGSQPYPGRTWQADYMTCYKNRTLSVQKCQHGYFQPQQHTCVEVINQVNIVSYCQVHSTDIVTDPSSCSKYFNCSDVSSLLGPYKAECNYPDLYSPYLRTCVQFDSVDCHSRPEPVTPCEYFQNKCDPSDTVCTPCTKRLPSCFGKQDGNNYINGSLWTPDYVVCRKNRTISVNRCAEGHFNPRTNVCEKNVYTVDIVQYCRVHQRDVVHHPDSCSQYYDCPRVLSTTKHVEECKYPDLFSVASLTCEAFETVNCGSRKEPQTACEYAQNLCPANDSACVSCKARLPSCAGLTDGLQMFGSQQWSTQYVDCYKNRTMAVMKCPHGSFFNPSNRRCTQNINKVDILSFCHAYPTAVRQHPTNCAQYYDCSLSTIGGNQDRECPYPQLFDTSTLSCKEFEHVQCGVRYEPKAPCEYKSNQCSPTQPACQPCTSRQPSCVGVYDGKQLFPGFVWHQQYLVCYKNRTNTISRCPGTNVFNPNTRQCVEITDITRHEIIDYCKAHPNAVLPDPDDCSRYYRCSLATTSGTSSHQQCTYPDLFSPADGQCVTFDRAQCSSRREPTAPCSYDHNKCLPSDNVCVPCYIRLPNCNGLSDGDNGIPGMLWSVNYVRCLTNRTLEVKRCSQGVFDPNIKACNVHVGPQHINELCFANPQAIVPHPTNCAQYFNCSKTNTQFGHYLVECDYPMLFDEHTLQCRTFLDVKCGTKSEPKAPCEYFRNICPVGNSTCTPCTGRFPRCVGISDGNNAIPGHSWTRDYMTCSKDRTLSTHTCTVGHFDPSIRSCSSNISPLDIPSYCKSNPSAVLPDPSNCGRYYNCGDPMSHYRQECAYPQLFSDQSMHCDDFQSVVCDQRPEPQAPCDYTMNQCQLGDVGCIPCQQRLPSCKGLPDGINAVPGRLWTVDYVQCLKNRTLIVQHCKSGIFDAVIRKCVEYVDPSKINQVCQANPRAILSDPTNCAKYYDCGAAPGFGLVIYYQKECIYPELFSTVTKSCRNFTTVRCTNRMEPQAPCEYTQNQCKTSFNCKPCSDRLPSCVGSPDGINAYPSRHWSYDYIVCLKNRTLHVTRCSNSLTFDPISRKCVRFVVPAHVPDYCTTHPRAVFPSSVDAAQYYDCSNPSSPVDVPHLQECNYPDLFDTLTSSCRDFTTVPTDWRPVPQAPCEYLRNRCSPTDAGCIPCPQRLFSCVMLPDGHNTIEGKQWSADYITCHLNRTIGTNKCIQGVFDPNTRQCIIQPTSGPATIADQCQLEPSKIIPHPGSCALYYNCSKSVATYGPILPVQLEECGYPDLYSKVYHMCLDFQYVQCDNRHEVKAPCQYLQNQCHPTDSTCAPCPERLPSCIGFPDGDNAIIGRRWSPDYLRCFKERTLGVQHCQNGVFNPNTKRCDTGIDNGNIDEYCNTHPQERIADSNNCAQYFDCSQTMFRIGVAMAGDRYHSQECHYPDLFSIATKRCDRFARVTCDKRPEPQAPCEYSQNLCQHGDSTCRSCSSRLPSCVGLHDGHVAIPGREYTATYLDCKNNRTLAVNTCQSGFFDAGLRMCVTKINSANIDPYCKRNDGAILPHPTNCAWYYNCSVTGRTLQSVYPFDIEYVQECHYPELFSSATMRCEHFQSVPCNGHFEPQAPCEYFKNRCDPSLAGCVPCPNRLPSCKGLPDGKQTIKNLFDGLQYLVDCLVSRTMSYRVCARGAMECNDVTTPVTHLLTTQAPATTHTTAKPTSICARNVNRMVSNPQHCGQYYDCTRVSPPFLKECLYPQMFSEFTRRCEDFQSVTCNGRQEYKTPCEYQQNKCAPSNRSCTLCHQRLPSCLNIVDGSHPFPGREGTSHYITCLNGRTVLIGQCPVGVFHRYQSRCSVPTIVPSTSTPTVNTGDTDSYCRAHPYDTLQDPSNCAKYYDCRDIFTTSIISAKECPYPLLYHPLIRTCGDFSTVQCQKRYEPQAPCEYSSNQCQGAGCIPCSQRLVSCVGLSDGNHAYPRQQLSSKYVRCQRNRTIATEHCNFGIFEPASRQCRFTAASTTAITTRPNTIDAYCKSNPNGAMADSTNCALYYTCVVVNTPLGNHLMECPYPLLFDGLTNVCRDRIWVKCGQRTIPSSQCGYRLYQCIGFDCQRCPGQIQSPVQTFAPLHTPAPTLPVITTRAPTTHSISPSGPNCSGRPDGLNPYPGREVTAYYIVCDHGMVVETGICIINKILDPIRRRCTDPADPDVIDAYCSANPGVTIPSVTNCAQFYTCGKNINDHHHELQECKYPQLFSTVDNTCKPFSQVQCGQRIGPISPCES